MKSFGQKGFKALKVNEARHKAPEAQFESLLDSLDPEVRPGDVRREHRGRPGNPRPDREGDPQTNRHRGTHHRTVAAAVRGCSRSGPGSSTTSPPNGEQARQRRADAAKDAKQAAKDAKDVAALRQGKRRRRNVGKCGENGRQSCAGAASSGRSACRPPAAKSSPVSRTSGSSSSNCPKTLSWRDVPGSCGTGWRWSGSALAGGVKGMKEPNTRGDQRPVPTTSAPPSATSPANPSCRPATSNSSDKILAALGFDQDIDTRKLQKFQATTSRLQPRVTTPTAAAGVGGVNITGPDHRRRRRPRRVPPRPPEKGCSHHRDRAWQVPRPFAGTRLNVRDRRATDRVRRRDGRLPLLGVAGKLAGVPGVGLADQPRTGRRNPTHRHRHRLHLCATTEQAISAPGADFPTHARLLLRGSPRFRGHVDEINVEVNHNRPDLSHVSIECVDMFDHLSNVELLAGIHGMYETVAGATPKGQEQNIYYPADQVDDRMILVLDEAGVPTALQNVFSGNVVVMEKGTPAAPPRCKYWTSAPTRNGPASRTGSSPPKASTRSGADTPDSTRRSYDANFWEAGTEGHVTAGRAQIRRLQYSTSKKLIVNSALAYVEGIGRERDPRNDHRGRHVDRHLRAPVVERRKPADKTAPLDTGNGPAPTRRCCSPPTRSPTTHPRCRGSAASSSASLRDSDPTGRRHLGANAGRRDRRRARHLRRRHQRPVFRGRDHARGPRARRHHPDGGLRPRSVTRRVLGNQPV